MKHNPIKVIKLDMETETGEHHGIFFTPRELYTMIGAMAVLNDLGAFESIHIESTDHVYDCFCQHMEMIAELMEPEQIHQLFHRMQDFFSDRKLV